MQCCKLVIRMLSLAMVKMKVPWHSRTHLVLISGWRQWWKIIRQLVMSQAARRRSPQAEIHRQRFMPNNSYLKVMQQSRCVIQRVVQRMASRRPMWQINMAYLMANKGFWGLKWKKRACRPMITPKSWLRHPMRLRANLGSQFLMARLKLSMIHSRGRRKTGQTSSGPVMINLAWIRQTRVIMLWPKSMIQKWGLVRLSQPWHFRQTPIQAATSQGAVLEPLRQLLRPLRNNRREMILGLGSCRHYSLVKCRTNNSSIAMLQLSR